MKRQVTARVNGRLFHRLLASGWVIKYRFEELGMMFAMLQIEERKAR